MALVPAICTQCGAQIEVDNTQEACVCKHCGTAFVTEKAINNYSTYITNHIHTDNVLMGTMHVDELVSDAYKCLDSGAYNAVLTLYRKIQKEYPADYRGYWLECIFETYNFNPNKIRYISHSDSINYAYPLQSDPNKASAVFSNAYNLAPDTEKDNMLQKYREYIRLYNIKVDEFNRKEQEEYHQRKAEEDKRANEYKKARFRNEVTTPVAAILFFLVLITIGFFSLSNAVKGFFLFIYVLIVIACPIGIYVIIEKWKNGY